MDVCDQTHPDRAERVGVLKEMVRFAKKWSDRPSGTVTTIDVFVTHAWIDDHKHPGRKYAAFLALNDAFKRAFGRPVRLWYEKCCIAQDDADVMDKVALLPVFISACTTLACMYSDDWAKRLWCLSEAADLAALSPAAHARLARASPPPPH